MIVRGVQKLTLLDFPGLVACTVFTGGCDLRCPFCHNAALVLRGGDCLPPDRLFRFLKKRRGVLDGVCVTGGEPLLQPDLEEFLIQLRELGYKIKLDTNGTMPDRLEPLIARKRMDYIAMDIKNCPARYGETVGRPDLDLGCIRRSMALIRGSGIPYEFRTTVVRELHREEDLTDLARWLEPEDPWFLQQFQDSGDLICPGLTAWEPDALKQTLIRLKEIRPKAALRGI